MYYHVSLLCSNLTSTITTTRVFLCYRLRLGLVFTIWKFVHECLRNRVSFPHPEATPTGSDYGEFILTVHNISGIL